MKLDFGLSHTMLSEEFRKAWPYEFGLVYRVTLTKSTLQTALEVRNEGTQNFEFQVLMHSYLRIAVCLLAVRGVGCLVQLSPIWAHLI